MEAIRIEGGAVLRGDIKAQGAKNSITKLLVASLLSDKKCIFYNVPNIVDVEITLALCEEIGSELSWDRTSGVIEIITRELKTSYIPQRFSGSNRIPILMIGALLGRTSEDIIVPTSGGCDIGKRSVDFHIEALSKLGASIEYRSMKKEGAYFAQAHNGLKGAEICLPYPSVGATENTLLAAVRAQSKTVIRNAAIEPEVLDLVLFLQKMGACVSIESDRTICVERARNFKEVQHAVIPDRIEAASFAMAALATKGRIFIASARQDHMLYFLHYFRKIGGDFNVTPEGIEFFSTSEALDSFLIETDVHPGFMTDWQQPFVVCLTQRKGTFVVHETVYEKRFGYIKMLKKMGAEIELFKNCLGPKKCRFAHQDFVHSAIIKGPVVLKGTEIAIPDLRAGFAYVLAALIAEGTSSITNTSFLDRGYEDVVKKLQTLGAKIKRVHPVKKEQKIEKDLLYNPEFKEISTVKSS